MNSVGAAIHSIKEDEREFQYQAKAVRLKGIVRIKNDATCAIGCEYGAALFACPRLSGAEQQAREFGSAVSGSDVEAFDVADPLICEIGRSVRMESSRIATHLREDSDSARKTA
jgi:hypothetical protein